MFVTSRNRMGIQIFIIFLWLFTCLILFQLPVYSKESQLKILLLDFEKIGGHQRYDVFKQDLPKKLKSFLNQNIEAIILAERFGEVREKKECFSTLPQQEPMIGFLTDASLKLIIDCAKGDYSHILTGRFRESFGQIRVELRLIDCQTNKITCSFQERDADPDKSETIQEGGWAALERLAKKFSKYIETHLVARIRIGLIDFEMTGGSSDFCFLKKSIPTMLATGLSVSRQFLLIETKAENLLESKRGESSKGISDPTTMIDGARKKDLNYLIIGEFWERKNKMRIDARCVSVETSEIILSEDIILKRIEVDNISEEIKFLASKIRIKIEKDFMEKEKQIKSIAVISFPPRPNSKKSRLMADNIRRTLVRKLRIVDPDKLRVKDDSNKIEKYLKTKEDKLKICSDLGVGSLLTIQYEDIREKMIILDIDLYDIEQPYRELLPKSERMKYTKSDEFINCIVFEALKKLDINLANDDKEKGIKDKEKEIKDKEKIKAIRVPTFATRWAVGVSSSSIMPASDDLYLTSRRSGYLEFFVNYQLNNRLQLEFHVGYYLGNKITIKDTDFQAQVSSWLNSFLFKCDLVKGSPFDIYAGLGGTFFQVFRSCENLQTEEKGYAGAYGGGLMAICGAELKIEKLGLSLFFEPRYILGTKVKQKPAIGYDFPGGRLGGLYLTTKIAYNFNF